MSNNSFYIHWENEYSKIVFLSANPNPMTHAGPFNSLNEAKRNLIEFLNTKITDTKNNLQEIKALRSDNFSEEEEKDDL